MPLLKTLARPCLEGIFATKLTMRRIINKWQETSSVCHKTSMAGVLANTKISKREMINLNGLVLEDKEVTVVSCKNRLGLRAFFKIYINKIIIFNCRLIFKLNSKISNKCQKFIKMV
jgi:hypothetical protein